MINTAQRFSFNGVFFQVVSSHVMKEKRVFITALMAGFLSYAALSRLDANRFVSLSAALLPMLFAIGWTVRSSEEKKVSPILDKKEVADSIWAGSHHQLDKEIAEELRKRIEMEREVPYSVVGYLLAQYGWSDVRPSYKGSTDAQRVKTALRLIANQEVEVKKLVDALKKGGNYGRPEDTVDSGITKLKEEVEPADQGALKDAVYLLLDYRQWWQDLSS